MPKKKLLAKISSSIQKPARRKKGYAESSKNATKHGILADNGLLKTESPEDFQALLDDLIKEYEPVGPTERHLVEQIAYIMVKRKRLRAAERSSYTRNIDDVLTGKDIIDGMHSNKLIDLVPRGKELSDHYLISLVRRTILRMHNDGTLFINIKPQEVLSIIFDSHKRLEFFKKAISKEIESIFSAYKVLNDSNSSDSEAAAQLGPILQYIWETQDDQIWTNEGFSWPDKVDFSSLRKFLNDVNEILFHHNLIYNYADQLQNQAFDESFDADKMLKFARYEAHLNKQFKDTLKTLIALQELRAKKLSIPIKASKLLTMDHDLS